MNPDDKVLVRHLGPGVILRALQHEAYSGVRLYVVAIEGRERTCLGADITVTEAAPVRETAQDRRVRRIVESAQGQRVDRAWASEVFGIEVVD